MERIFENYQEFSIWASKSRITIMKNSTEPRGDLFKNTDYAGDFRVRNDKKVVVELLRKHISFKELNEGLWT